MTALAAAALVILAFVAPARASLWTERASGFVAAVADRVVGAIRAQDLDKAERLKRYGHIFDAALDIEGIARTALGRHWNALTLRQRSDYLRLFREHLIRIYARRFGGRAGAALAILGAVEAPSAEILVSGRITAPGIAPLDTVFRVARLAGGLRIVDVTVDGVSLVLTKRAEFDSLVNRRGIDGLLAALGGQEPKPVEPAAILRSL